MNNVNNYQYYSGVNTYAIKKAYSNKRERSFRNRITNITVLKEYYKNPMLRNCLSKKCIEIISNNQLGKQSNQSLGQFVSSARKKSKKLIQKNVQMDQK